MLLTLGPFDLIEPVARGGMATVWRGSHRVQQVPVAIKVLSGSVAERADFERRFAEEVRAVAALDHPGIVMVLDHGRIEPELRHPQLTVGSPWLAMEYASGGTLASNKGPMPWPMVKAVLLALLDALGHAHAHGLVHRDLKPANVLVASPTDARPGIKLSDFGIAYAGGREDGDAVVGTPSYMAPEQIRGEWRDFGPWTDLYALGCLAFWMCTGRTPFAGGRPQRTMMAHLVDPVPPFASRIPVPDGFAGWVGLLLEKSVDRRFQLAADAACALTALADPPLGPTSEVVDLDPAFQATLTHTSHSFGESWRLAFEERPPTDAGVAHQVDARAPPMPNSWRRPVAKPLPMQLVGAGLSLYGLRAIQIAGREAERDALWRSLVEVARTGRAQAVLLHGPAGTGKSRLAEWLCRRAQELGAAVWSKASFAREKAPGQALQEMGVNYLRCGGLLRDDVERRVRAFLLRHGSTDEAECDVLTELLCPATSDDLARGVRHVRLTRPREFYAGTSNTMYRLGTERPLIAWFDDIQSGLHGLGLAIEVLRTQDVRPFPCLMVLTMRNEDLDDDSNEARRLQRLLDTPGAVAMPIGPLAPGAHRELVRGLLGLEDGLAARVEERTAGNPLFAIQLVGSWVQDGTLEVGAGGFRLKAGTAPTLPDDLHAVWSRQVRVVLDGFSPVAQGYLEIAAALGLEVQRQEWRRACDDPRGVFGDRFPGDEPLRARLVERLLAQHLVVGSVDLWSFSHGMLRESLLRTAREGGRLAAHHEACATLMAQHAADPAGAERLGRHLLEAGRTDEAIAPLLRGVVYRLVTVGGQPAQALLASVEEALVAVHSPASDPRWGEVFQLRARILQEAGELRQALDETRRAHLAALAHGWTRVAHGATEIEVRLLLRLHQVDEAEALLEPLAVRAANGRDPVRSGVIDTLRAEVARRRGMPAEAIQILSRAIEAFDAAKASPHVGALAAQAALDWGRCAATLGNTAEAQSATERALLAFTAIGSGLGVAECHDRLGRLAAMAGNFAGSEPLLVRALSQYEALGAERQLSCRMRLARVVLRRDPDRVWAIVERVQPQLSRLDHRGRVAASHALKLVQYALAQDWAAWDQALVEAGHQPPTAGGAVGAAWLSWLAGEAACLVGDHNRGRVVLRIAAALFRAGGDLGVANEVEGSVPMRVTLSER